jgi:hypothetical protein
MPIQNTALIIQNSDEQETSKNDDAFQNAGWYSYSDESDVAVVFVHGFKSDSQSCWTHSSGTYWPDLLRKDERIPNLSIFLGGYFTGIDSDDYGVLDCSNELHSLLSTKQSGGRRTPLNFPNIVFVCHSLGGIVTRYLLDSKRQWIANKSIGLVLIASPSLGSEYANIFEGVSEFFRNRVGTQLKKNSELLRDLDNRFKSFLDDEQNFKIAGIEAIETQGYLHTKLCRFLAPIVSRESAGRYFGNPQLIAKTNHSTIAKPCDQEHATHRLLVNFFDNKFSKIIQEVTPVIDSIQVNSRLFEVNSLHHQANKVLFDVYDSSCREYYFERNIDSEISQVLNSSGLWLTGLSGSGKTSLIKHYLELNGKKPIQLSFSQLVDDFSPKSCLKEIAETCVQMEIGGRTNTPTTLSALSSVLANYAKQSSIVLYLDEVPINKKRDNEVQNFYQFVLDLMNSVKQNSEAGTKFIISSIENPSFIASNKFKEYMAIRSIPIWTENELEKLYFLIVKRLPLLAVQPDFLGTLLIECKGAPRFLKAFLRHKLNELAINTTDIIILQKTIRQFDW